MPFVVPGIIFSVLFLMLNLPTLFVMAVTNVEFMELVLILANLTMLTTVYAGQKS